MNHGSPSFRCLTTSVPPFPTSSSSSPRVTSWLHLLTFALVSSLASDLWSSHVAWDPSETFGANQCHDGVQQITADAPAWSQAYVFIFIACAWCSLRHFATVALEGLWWTRNSKQNLSQNAGIRRSHRKLSHLENNHRFLTFSRRKTPCVSIDSQRTEGTQVGASLLFESCFFGVKKEQVPPSSSSFLVFLCPFNTERYESGRFGLSKESADGTDKSSFAKRTQHDWTEGLAVPRALVPVFVQLWQLVCGEEGLFVTKNSFCSCHVSSGRFSSLGCNGTLCLEQYPTEEIFVESHSNCKSVFASFTDAPKLWWHLCQTQLASSSSTKSVCVNSRLLSPTEIWNSCLQWWCSSFIQMKEWAWKRLWNRNGWLSKLCRKQFLSNYQTEDLIRRLLWPFLFLVPVPLALCLKEIIGTEMNKESRVENAVKRINDIFVNWCGRDELETEFGVLKELQAFSHHPIIINFYCFADINGATYYDPMALIFECRPTTLSSRIEAGCQNSFSCRTI